MDTYEARRQIRDLAHETLDLLEEVAHGETSHSAASTDLRKMEAEARTLLADAGYPGEAAWRGVQRARLTLEADTADAALTDEVEVALREAISTLDSLTTGPLERDADFRIIG